MEYKLILGDCLDKIKELEEDSIDSIVTDPPYHLTSIVKRFGKEGSAPAKPGKDGSFSRLSRGFMGQEWDGGDIAFNTEVWEQCLRVLKPGGHLIAFSGSRTYHKMAYAIDESGFEIRDQIMWVYGSGFPKSHNIGKKVPDFEGWATALKPAHEPIVLARKPFKCSVSDNVLEHGTGAINIDGCRIGERYPANFIHDGLEEEWSKYFYCAKASKKDREDYNNHPTVKPTELMRYLVRLVTPKDGTVLDPFMGSGSTAKACVLENKSFIGIELSEDYLNIAKSRIENAITNLE
jgi:site-specific DNA-methyltransferase (adenine-specific)